MTLRPSTYTLAVIFLFSALYCDYVYIVSDLRPNAMLPFHSRTPGYLPVSSIII
jgi:hypothetical protein